MDIAKTLQEFALAEKELKRIEDKLAYYDNHPLASEHGIVKGSMKNYPYAEKSFKISAPNVKSDIARKEKVANILIQLWQRQKIYEDMLVDVDLAIESIEDTEMRIILQRYYVDKWTLQEIADELGYDRSTIGKKINNFANVSHNSHSK